MQLQPEWATRTFHTQDNVDKCKLSTSRIQRQTVQCFYSGTRLIKKWLYCFLLRGEIIPGINTDLLYVVLPERSPIKQHRYYYYSRVVQSYNRLANLSGKKQQRNWKKKGKWAASYVGLFYSQSALYNTPPSPIHTRTLFYTYLKLTHFHTPMNTSESNFGFTILPNNTEPHAD